VHPFPHIVDFHFRRIVEHAAHVRAKSNKTNEQKTTRFRMDVHATATRNVSLWYPMFSFVVIGFSFCLSSVVISCFYYYYYRRVRLFVGTNHRVRNIYIEELFRLIKFRSNRIYLPKQLISYRTTILMVNGWLLFISHF